MVLMHSGSESVTNNHKCSINVENGEYNETTSTSFVAQIAKVLEKRDSRWIFGLISYNIVIMYLYNWVNTTNSVALSAYANTICFNVFALLVCLISIWVEQNTSANENFRKSSRPISIFGDFRLPRASECSEYKTSIDSKWKNIFDERIYRGQINNIANSDVPEYSEEHRNDKNVEVAEKENFRYESTVSLGLEKYEVFALFASSCLSLLAGFLVSGQVVTRLADQPTVHTGRLGLGILLGFLAHLGTIIGYPDAGLNHVVCKALPCPTLRGCNPILGGNMISALILMGTHLAIHYWEIHVTDTVAAFAVLALTATSMLPLAFYTLNVMIQKLPRHMSEQLDECLREALIIDGVLEFRNERFWTKSFGKLAGSLQVRIRKSANENYVLEKVMLRLSKIVSSLTIQEFPESRITDKIPDYPPDYYINEILSSHNDCIDYASYHSDRPSSSNDIDKNVCVSRIEDIIKLGSLKMENIEKPKSSSPDKKSAILQNDNIVTKDYLWRGDLTNKNSLLYGTKIDCEKFKDFFVLQSK